MLIIKTLRLRDLARNKNLLKCYYKDSKLKIILGRTTLKNRKSLNLIAFSKTYYDH